ncbi:MAG: aspartate kinase [Alicyclobacillaceae bacterium]|nr:aspartate kinase [Alicyclobacillaceae bacterium]
MKVVVQKFGGTSVVSRELRLSAVHHIESVLAEGYRVVVVVSAMGRCGDPYATDTLLSLVDDMDAMSRRDLDLLMSCGEIISAVVFAGVLRGRGHDAVVLTGAQAGIVTNDHFGDARIVEVRPRRIWDELEAGRIVVVSGFQGVTTDGEVTTLGRGGSDTTATALGVALDAAWVDIFTDVAGIMTADPRIVADARPLRRVTYQEICNLAYQGAKVIHPRAVEIAMQKNIPIRVRSTRLTSDAGTWVASATGVDGGAVRDAYVTGVTQTEHITQIQVEGTGDLPTRVFDAMARAGISVDFISVSPGRVAYTVSDSDAEQAVAALSAAGLQPVVVPDCAKVAAVGAGIAGVPGVMATMAKALAAEGIEILQSADSHTTIWCLVRRSQMEAAVRAVHQAFGLSAGPQWESLARTGFG